MYSNKSTSSSCCAVNVYKCHIIYRGYTKQQKDISWGKKAQTHYMVTYTEYYFCKKLWFYVHQCVKSAYIRERSQLQMAIYIVLVEYLNILGQHKPPTLNSFKSILILLHHNINKLIYYTNYTIKNTNITVHIT